MPYAINGVTDSKKANINQSTCVGLSYFDSKGKALKVDNIFEMWISRSEVFKIPNFKIFNTSNGTKFQNSTTENQYKDEFTNFITSLVWPNVSIHIHIKPLDLNKGYMASLRYGKPPVITQNSMVTDLYKIFCPTGKLYF